MDLNYQNHVLWAQTGTYETGIFKNGRQNVFVIRGYKLEGPNRIKIVRAELWFYDMYQQIKKRQSLKDMGKIT